ncbi:MAG TPA: alkane 1-monooxygenase [Rhizomicrobium sp.]|nr:alkane 1-monooxygenase [Rhizomicrobium sp.]
MIRYASAFLLSAAIPLLYYWQPWAPVLILPAILVLLLGAELIARRGPVATAIAPPFAFRMLPLLYIPAQLAVIAWAIFAARNADAIGIAALVLSIGLTTGIFGMLTAHEMVHSKSRSEQAWGALMLTGMTYRHFRVAHIYGHHRWAATSNDAATAKLGESFYGFLIRTVPTQLRDAWRFEQWRCRKSASGWMHNRANHDIAIAIIVFAGAAALGGIRGVIFFTLESAVAIAVLEMFNYVAHYGLIRTRDSHGLLEQFDHHHSWNSSNVFANPIIFNMGRHSDHHKRPSSPYETLRYIDHAPELPAGYAGSILLALVPPLWWRVMNPKVQRVREIRLVPVRTAS